MRKQWIGLLLIMMLLLTFFTASAESNAVFPLFQGQTTDSQIENTVRNVQKMLKEMGFYTGNVTGHFGDKTAEGIRSFQKEMGSVATGVVTSGDYSLMQTKYKEAYRKGTGTAEKDSTAAADNTGNAAEQNVGTKASVSYGSRTMKKDTQGEDVRMLQDYLRTLGFYSGNSTGNYGALTMAAVRKFQRANKLTVDGIAGGKTASAILAKVNEKNNASSGATEKEEAKSDASAKNTETAVTKDSAEKDEAKKTEAAGNSNVETAKEADEKNVKETTATKVTLGSRTIRLGVKGTDVTELQQALKSLGFYSGSVTGNCGSITVSAIRKFQKANNLKADGAAGAKTIALLREKLSGGKSNAATAQTTESTAKTASPAGSGTLSAGKNLRRYQRSEEVRALQEALAKLGYFAGSPTGYFGEQTEKAVKAFQNKHNLLEDGIAGKATINAILKELGQ